VARDIKSFFVEAGKIVLLEKEWGAKLLNTAMGIWHGLFRASQYARDHPGTPGRLP
jgi:hypothetical protein